jgi:hypothetical protein
MFTLIPDPLALIGLGRLKPTDLRCCLADLLLVDAGDDDRRLVRALDTDTVYRLVVDSMAEPEVQGQASAR